jgi:hypothetical protein
MLSEDDLKFLFDKNPISAKNNTRAWNLTMRIYGPQKEEGCLEQYKNYERILKLKAIENAK